MFVLYLAGLAVFIMALTRLSLWVRPSQHDKEQDWYRDRESRKRQRNPSQASIGTLAGQIDAIGDELYAQRKQQHHHENRRHFLEKIGVIAAIVAAVLAGLSAWIFNSQLEEMRSEQRPWVELDPENWTGS